MRAPDDEARWRELWAGLPRVLRSHGRRRLSPIQHGAGSSIRRRQSPCASRKSTARWWASRLSLTHEGTWIDGKDCYLEDLFVDSAARGKGVGPGVDGRSRLAFQDERLVAALLAHRAKRTRQRARSTTATSRTTAISAIASTSELRKALVEFRMIAFPVRHARLGQDASRLDVALDHTLRPLVPLDVEGP